MNWLILGGTGTLGKSITKYLLKTDIKSVRVFSRNEYDQVEMQRDCPDTRLRFLIGDIRDRNRLTRAMEGIDYVVNCAALKHVPVCEYNPIEAIRTNIDGAVNVIDCAIDTEVKKVINISSDKAVYPINLYGATKLVSEKLFIYSNIYGKGKTLFSCVRFGNFIGSRGSVIPLWEKQRETGTITLTEKDMVRYWIDIDKASEFVLDSIERMKGGEIFIPLMPSQTMAELAKQIAPECKLNIIGKRQGEKLNELLWNEDEKPVKTEWGYVIK